MKKVIQEIRDVMVCKYEEIKGIIIIKNGMGDVTLPPLCHLFGNPLPPSLPSDVIFE